MRRDTAIPLYYQLETILRQKILSGELPPGEALPSEDALAEEYRVSRITVRQALALLERDGLVVRRRGKGTFVSATLPQAEWSRSSGFMEELIAMGVRTKVRLISRGVVEAHGVIQERLRPDDPGPVYRLEKVRLVEGSPFSYVVDYLPLAIGRRLEKVDLTEKPLLTILEEYLGIKAAEAIQTIEATVADPAVAALLEIRAGDPLLKVERAVYDQEGRPVEFLVILYRADKYCFTVKLRRGRADQGLSWALA